MNNKISVMWDDEQLFCEIYVGDKAITTLYQMDKLEDITLKLKKVFDKLGIEYKEVKQD